MPSVSQVLKKKELKRILYQRLRYADRVSQVLKKKELKRKRNA